MFHSAAPICSITRSFAGRLLGGLLLLFSLRLSVAGQTAESAGGISEKPLAPHASPPGKTMFVQLPPEATGVKTENRYADPKMWTELHSEFELGAIGTGVAIGDYDGDGRPDIFVVSKTETCRLFRNLGNWKFEDVTEKAGVGDSGTAAAIWKQGATFADINNDGRLDLYVCRFNAPNLLYINQGDGTFKEMAHAYGLDVTDASGMAIFCDYDHDGWLDVFVQTNVLNFNAHPNGQSNYLFHNNRNGTFTNVTQIAGISGEAQGHSATWWDYNNDGWPDLYVANDFKAADKLYRNNRDGSFTDVIDQVVPHTPYSAMGSDIGDVNNDGLIDFFVPDMAATTHEKDQRGMAHSRGQTIEDDKKYFTAPQYEHNALFLNTGTGRCLEAAFLAGIAATDWSWAVRFEDLDNDGRLDLFATNGMHREANNVDLLARQMNAENPTEVLRVMRDSPILAETHLAFRNKGGLEFQNVGAEWGLNQKGVAFGAAFGDLDGDGNLDLVYSNYQAGVTVLRNDNATGHRIIIDLRGTISNRYGVGATVKIESAAGVQVRQLVLARGYLSSSEPMIHFGLGEDTIIKRLTVAWPSRREQVFENLGVNRRFTITEPSEAEESSRRSPFAKAPEDRKAAPTPEQPGQFAEVSVALGLALSSQEEPTDETALQRLIPIRLNRRGPALAVGNLDGDDAEDLVIGGTTVNRASILLHSVAGPFKDVTSTALFPVGTVNDGPLLLFEANGDGKQDLLVTKGGNSLPMGSPEYQPKLFFSDGHGGFRPAPNDALPLLPISAGAVAAADFTHNGRLGFFIGGRVANGQYPLAPRSALLVNRRGKFEDVTESFAPGLREVGMVTSALWSDVDGDGWIDLLLCLEWGTVKYFHNQRGQHFEDWTERSGFASAGNGWWTSMATADFNGDGQPDYVAGNIGLNTQYQASAQQPALLFLGDFKGSEEEPQIVEAYHDGGQIYPWRSRRDLGAAIPSVLKRFPKNNTYARATLGEIVGADKLAAAQRFAVTELRSGVFLSQPDGTFHFETLPRLAQIAPMQGIVTGDFDGDGYADIYAVQNSYAPIPAVGRFDGGLSQLLRGDGHGHFVPVPPAESNLIVPGDAKALVALDLNQDGWADFVISRNNSSTLAFQNRGMPGRHSLRVQLRGPAGNPTAVGAHITLKFADGSSQSGEIGAGSGLMSQSSADCFFGWIEGHPPTQVEVRWPSGAVTKHTIVDLPATLAIPEPVK